MVPFGQFAHTSVGSAVEWDTAEATQFFHDLPTDQAPPKYLITGSTVAVTG
jgi:hypothetical protein